MAAMHLFCDSNRHIILPGSNGLLDHRSLLVLSLRAFRDPRYPFMPIIARRRLIGPGSNYIINPLRRSISLLKWSSMGPAPQYGATRPIALESVRVADAEGAAANPPSAWMKLACGKCHAPSPTGFRRLTANEIPMKSAKPPRIRDVWSPPPPGWSRPIPPGRMCRLRR